MKFRFKDNEKICIKVCRDKKILHLSDIAAIFDIHLGRGDNDSVKRKVARLEALKLIKLNRKQRGWIFTNEENIPESNFIFEWQKTLNESEKK